MRNPASGQCKKKENENENGNGKLVPTRFVHSSFFTVHRHRRIYSSPTTPKVSRLRPFIHCHLRVHSLCSFSSLYMYMRNIAHVGITSIAIDPVCTWMDIRIVSSRRSSVTCNFLIPRNGQVIVLSCIYIYISVLPLLFSVCPLMFSILSLSPSHGSCYPLSLL